MWIDSHIGKLVLVLSAALWLAGGVFASVHATEEAILHSEDTILGFSDGLNSVQNGDPQSEDKNDEGHDHPAHAPCGSCHGHAVGVSDLAIPTVGAVSLLFQRLFDAPLSSLIDGLFRPPRV